MATINNIPIFVETESYSNDTDIPQHPTESGFPLTDNVRVKPASLSIDGKIVKANSLSASDIITKIEALRTKGSLITYKGNRTLKNLLIQNFNYDFSADIWGGANFSMELVEVRIAKSSYKKPKQGTSKTSNGGTQQVQSSKKEKQPVYYTVKKGDTVWALVNGPYKSLGKSCDWVIDNNPQCFSRKGDPRTLQIGTKLLVGYK